MRLLKLPGQIAHGLICAPVQRIAMSFSLFLAWAAREKEVARLYTRFRAAGMRFPLFESGQWHDELLAS